MAGEWIKVSSNLHTKPEVFKMARLLSQSVDTTVGMLLRFWCWADGATVDGVVDAVETDDVDAIVGKVGFCSTLMSVGWVKKPSAGAGIEIVNFERHNGESAKKRALKNGRQARWRANHVDELASTKASTREEKRREDKDTSAVGAVTVEALQADGLTEATAREFLQTRKRKRAPLTPTAWDGIKGEASKAGWPIETAIRKCLARGWQSFDASWVTDSKTNAPAADPPWKGAI